MKIAILGYGNQGRAALDYWSGGGHEITICDANADLQIPDGTAARLGDDYLKDLHQFDLLVRTPILHPRDIMAANPETSDILSKVTSVTNEFLQVCPSKNIIGVTGTKGKGTTSTLITKMLEAAGKRVHLGGNIGTPPLDLLKNDIRPEDWVVLELANFQLIDLKHSPHIAVCLMVAPEHQDWHDGMDEYVEAKQQLFAHQTKDDIAIYYAVNELSKRVAEASPGVKIPYFSALGATVENNKIVIGDKEICAVEDIKLLGKHNWQNICAAITAVWQVTQDTEAIRSVATSLTNLPHRLELVREKDGVKYYNDSFASMPGAVMAAIDSIPEPKVMIIGGYDRGLDITQMAQAIVRGNIKHVVAIGTTAKKMVDAIDALKDQRCVTWTIWDNNKVEMPEIVKAARSQAGPGDAVVLSPGFASFDMFKNFEDRGLKFKEAVQAL